MYAASGAAARTTLDALRRGQTRPQRVLLLDATPEGTLTASSLTTPSTSGPTDDSTTDAVAGLAAGPAPGTPADEPPAPLAVEVRRVDPETGAKAAYAQVTPDDLQDVAALWLLPAGSVPEPTALRRLLEELRRSPTTGVVGPKLLHAVDGQLRIASFGIRATRTGRVVPDTVEGTHDQGQESDRRDVLAVSGAGMLVDVGTWQSLGGFRADFGDLGSDLDFGWRAQLGDHRVIVAPLARVVVPAGEGLGSPETSADRRGARRVALARCGWLSAPFIALWIALSSLASGLVLLLAKHPRAAMLEVGDIGAVLDPWRPIGARWAARREHHIARAHLDGLFLTSRDIVGHVSDQIGGVAASPVEATPEAVALESGPSSEDDAFVDRGSLERRVLGSPAVWVTLAAFVAALVVHRTVTGGPVAALQGGLAGGELVAGPVDPAALLRSWWDAWPVDGAGPAAAVMAGPAWLMAHVPWLGVTNPGGSAVTALLVLAPAVAAFVAYRAGRVVTRRRLVRGAVALAYATGPVTWSAATHGRVGPLVALVLLPAILALAGRIAAGQGSVSSAAGLALSGAVVTAFVPAVGVALLVVTAILVLAARGRGHGQALVAVVGWCGLLGPWLLALFKDPAQLLSGPGALAYGGTVPSTGQLLSLNVDGTRGLFGYAAVPVLVLAVLALGRGRSRAVVQLVLGAGAVLALAAALLAPRITVAVLGTGPSAREVTPWWGTALLLVWALGLALVLVGYSDLSAAGPDRGRTALARAPLAVALGVGVLLPAVPALWTGGQGGLSVWRDPRPAIAVDQATPPLANRTLLIGSRDDAAWTQLLDGDRVLLARGANPTPEQPWPLVRVAAAGVLDGAPGRTTATTLTSLGAGFLGVQSRLTGVADRLDATAGLVRMGSKGGFDYWRVEPPTSTTGAMPGVPRVRVVTGSTSAMVPVTHPGAGVDEDVTAAAGSQLVVSEPPAIAQVLRVAADGQPLSATPDTAAPAGPPAFALPAGTQHVSVTTPPANPWSRWLAIGAALVLAFLAVPSVRTRRTR